MGTGEVVEEVAAEAEEIFKISRFALLGHVEILEAISVGDVEAVVVVIGLEIAAVEMPGVAVAVAEVVVLKALESSSESCNHIFFYIKTCLASHG